MSVPLKRRIRDVGQPLSDITNLATHDAPLTQGQLLNTCLRGPREQVVRHGAGLQRCAVSPTLLPTSCSTNWWMLMLPFFILVVLSSPELVTPAKVHRRQNEDSAAVKRSLKARRASQARWKHTSRTRATPPFPLSMGCPRPSRGLARKAWEASRATLVECQQSLSALRRRLDDEVGRTWTLEGTIHIIYSVIQLMAFCSFTESHAVR